MRRIFLDTEFTNLPWTSNSKLIWIGLADEHRRSWSALVADVDRSTASDFVNREILPRIPAHEPCLSRAELCTAIIEFCGEVDELWAWCPSETDLIALGLTDGQATNARRQWWDWDYQLLRQLIDAWPPSWPTRCNDLHALADAAPVDLPPNPNAHHPAADALWNADVFAALRPR